jgi:carbamoyl-phosphate synthase large subunit
MEVHVVNKYQEGRPHIVDMLKNHEIDFIINTTEGKQAIADSYMIRRTALQNKVCYTTTMAGGRASVAALSHGRVTSVYSLQSLHS